MSMTNRQEQIISLLNENGFMTVEQLSQLTYASSSSVCRDLTKLQNMYLVKRTHGGARILDDIRQVMPFDNRLKQNTTAKRKIAQKASSLLKDWQVVMLDGSTTASFLVPYIAEHKGFSLITNNMLTALNATKHGITTYCIGGKSVTNEAVLTGPQSYKAMSEIHPDILFFSSKSIDSEGMIYDPNEDESYLRALMISNAKKSVFLCDSGKFNTKSIYHLASIDDIDYAVFDTEWKELDTKCKIL